jgi:hypothetical protein
MIYRFAVSSATLLSPTKVKRDSTIVDIDKRDNNEEIGIRFELSNYFTCNTQENPVNVNDCIYEVNKS